MSREKKVQVRGIGFTPRELSIIKELRRGLSYQEISENLSISIKTVEYYIKNIKAKTNTTSKKELFDFFREEATDSHVPSRNKLNLLSNKKELLYLLFLSLTLGTVFIYLNNNRNNDKEITNVLNFSDNFLCRLSLENKIIQKLKKQDGIGVVVIYGEGGAGKTTIARKVLSDLNAGVKFEINAETEDTLYNSFVELAYYLAITKDQKNELDIIRNLEDPVLQKKRLIRFVSVLLKKINNWSLSIDNVRSFESIKGYFPINEKLWGKGYVLVTTRNQHLGENNFIRQDCLIDIGTLGENDKQELFSNIVYDCHFKDLHQDTKNKVQNFLKNIPEFPLDICAVAYYLKNTKITFEEYEKLMEKSIKDLTQEQRKLMKENANYEETRYGIVSAIFKEIIQNPKEFKLLLLIFTLMDSQNIPKNILKDVAGVINTNNFINKLKEHSLVTDNGNAVSMHRSNHEIGYDYIVQNLETSEFLEGIHMLAEAIYKNSEQKSELVPHLESILSKISKIDDQGIVEDKAKLLVMISDIFRNQSGRMNEALGYLEKIMVINQKKEGLNKDFLAKVMMKMGEIYTVMNKNDQADDYLSKSLKYLSDTMEKIRNYRLLGIIRMRQHMFESANEYFILGLNLLKNIQASNVKKKLAEADLYEDMAFNYFMEGINRENTKAAIPLMNKAIKVLDDQSLQGVYEVLSRKVVHKMKLAGIYNALGEYQKSLEIAKETEGLIKNSGFESTDTFYAKGIIARERGIAYLRQNNPSKALDYFKEARRIFTKLMKGDYLYKLKTDEAECLVRLNELDKAMDICESMFAEEGRERNNYTDLFLNSSYYHAAVIKYKKKEYKASREYFRKFFRLMNGFCKAVLKNDVYLALKKQDIFNENADNMIRYFENSLKIFEAIYWKNYEFTKYYVEENLRLAKINAKNL